MGDNKRSWFQHVVDMGDNIGATMVKRVLELYPEERNIRILDAGAGTGYIAGLVSRDDEYIFILMVQCKIAVSPLRYLWRYCTLALSHHGVTSMRR